MASYRSGEGLALRDAYQSVWPTNICLREVGMAVKPWRGSSGSAVIMLGGTERGRQVQTG